VNIMCEAEHVCDIQRPGPLIGIPLTHSPTPKAPDVYRRGRARGDVIHHALSLVLA
jgi:hypothetical protein